MKREGKKMTNIVCEKLGIKYPILQGPMAWASYSKLVAGVSNAGGLGILGIGFAPLDIMKSEITATKKLTDKPFGFNVYTFIPHVDAVCDIVIEEKIPVVEIGTLPHLFNSLPAYVNKLKDAGIVVIGKASTVEEAIAYEYAGVDFISLKGADGGGHIFGFTGTFSLLPQVADAVSVPVINSSGIADGRGIAASLILGAKAVELGSRFLLAHECPVHENYKQAIQNAKEGDTVLTGIICGDAVRQLRNRLSDKILCVEKEYTPQEASQRIQELATDSLRKAAEDGNIDEGCVTVGQVVGMLRKRQSVKEIIDELVREYTALLKRAQYM